MLSGSLVTLRPWKIEDLEALQSLRNDVALQCQLMAKPKGNSEEQVKSWLTHRSNDPNSLLLIVADRQSNNAVGYLQLTKIDLFLGIGHLGVCISPEVQGHGFGGEAICLLEGYLKNILCLRKILLEVLLSNQKAIRFYERIGFREVGKLQLHYRTCNGFEDVMIMEKIIDK